MFDVLEELNKTSGVTGSMLVVEFEPALSDAVMARSLLVLVVCLVAALLLMSASFLFWHIARRANRRIQNPGDREAE